MENATQFDLNHAIQQWREDLAQSPAFCCGNLDELESHLRDSVAAQQLRGLTVEEAFIIAVKRIGKGAGLEAEFAKVNRRTIWLDRALWMMIGIQLWGLVFSAVGTIVRMALTFGWRNTNYSYYRDGSLLIFPITVFSLAQVLVMVASIALCWWLVVRNGPRLSGRFGPLLKRRSTLVATCAGLCLLALVASALNYALPVFQVRYLGVNALNVTALYSGYAYLVAGPVQIVTMIVITLFLARRRLRLTNA